MLFNDINFMEEDLKIINSYTPLAEWFSKNQLTITYFELTEPHFEPIYAKASENMMVFEKMVNTALCWIQSDSYLEKEKAIYAAMAIKKIYLKFQNRLDEQTLYLFDINTEQLNKCIDIDLLEPPKLKELELRYLEDKQLELTSEIEKIKIRRYELENK